MMADRLMGVETEYAFALLGDATLEQRSEALKRIMRLARARLPHLRGVHSSGIFLGNGARFYVDCGSHMEMTTPECLHPSDLCRYILAGELTLAALATDAWDHRPTSPRPTFFKANVDYSSGATWGTHENVCHRVSSQDVLAQQLLPFLASRVVFCGAGGFVESSAGLVFTLSPRSWKLVADVSGDSTSNRGLYHSKKESLCRNGYDRLHLLCGASLCSHIAMWLKAATTACVVALVEAGERPGNGVQLRCSSLDALRAFSLDTECKVEVPSAREGELTALDIQRHYLEAVETHLGDFALPTWAEEACHHWRNMLERLERSPSSVAATLDWAIKRVIFVDYATKQGFRPEIWPHWTHVLECIQESLEQAELSGKQLSVDFILSKKSPIRDTVRRLAPFLHENGLDWDQLGVFLEVRSQLFEIDWRFGQVGHDGLFATLDKAGVLSHEAPGVTGIIQAMHNPPESGRASVRGACVRKYAGQRRYAADWEMVVDRKSGRYIDLSDPYTSQEEWQERPAQPEDPIADERMRDLFERVLRRRRVASET